jgi:tetratricopeptide (TPR) repeat protein
MSKAACMGEHKLKKDLSQRRRGAEEKIMAEATWEQILQLGMAFEKKEEHENAIICFTKVIAMCSDNEILGNVYLFRGDAYKETGENEKAIADYKKSADYGEMDALTTLKMNGINYTPQKPSSSSAPNSGGSSAQPAQSIIKVKCPHCGFVNEKEPIVVMSETNLFHGNLYCNKCHETFKYEK